MTGRAALRSLALSVLAAFALLAAAVLRLQRVARPHERVLARYAHGAIEYAALELARPGMAPLALGVALRCGGREVLSRTGALSRLRVLRDDGASVLVRDGADERAPREWRVSSDCALSPVPAPAR